MRMASASCRRPNFYPGHFAQDAHGQTGTGKRVAVDERWVKPQFAPTARTSSLNSSRRGSTSSQPSLRGRPPTL